ncbi:MAG: hypothetical protein U9R43_03055 [Thermodesulfobacteriota bacterium]|nr:hypothetical protein [Thermodesulfobacteriota bacterium]
MHEKDRRKIMEAGFTLFRCSEIEKVIKKRTIDDLGWKIHSRKETKKAVKEMSQRLLSHPKVIQD